MNKQSSAVRIAAATVSACLAAIALTQAGTLSGNLAATDSVQESLQVSLRMASVDSLGIIAARPLLDSAQAVLVASDNRTDSDATRQALSDAVEKMNADLTGTMTDLTALSAESLTTGDVTRDADIARSVTAGMHDLGEISIDLGHLAAAKSAVVAAVAAHAAELQETARLVAQSYSLTVWTSGFQAQLDACRGAVDLTAAYGVRVIGEKWQCGGARFPQQGSLVSLGGIFAGLYRVGPTVAVLSAYTDSTRDIPRGYPLLYQTCRNGDAHTETFAELIPVS